MATRIWTGAALQVTEVKKIALSGTWSGGDTITVTINGKDAVVTIGTLTTNAQVATTIYQAWTGTTLTDTTASSSPTIADGGFQSIPEFYELNPASPTGADVILTNRVSGRPTTWNVTDTGASGTATGSTTTTATGRHFWSDADNWSGNTVPVNGDDVVFDSGDVDCKYGLSTGIQPGSVTFTSGYTGKAGLATINADDTARKYYEYRTLYATFTNNATTCTYTLGQGDGPQSKRIKIDAGAGQSVVVVHNTGSRNEVDFPTFIFKGTHASNTFTLFRGDAGIAFTSGETATIATLRCGTDSSDAYKLVSSAGVTLTTVTVAGIGTVELNTSCTTCTMTGTGTVTQYAGIPATLNCWSGTFRHRSTTALATACVIGGAGVLDRSGETRSATITPKISVYKGGKIKDPNATLTLTAGWQAIGCKSEDVYVDFGFNRSYTVT